ncbi:MAG: hypothetical protein ACKOCN_10580 [Planctomycetaceae bacterium]
MMSTVDEEEIQVSLPKKMDLYTAMLLLSFIAISIGCIVLAIDLSRYDFEIVPPGELKSNADLAP